MKNTKKTKSKNPRMNSKILDDLKNHYHMQQPEQRLELLHDIREWLRTIHGFGFATQPIDAVRWVPIEQVKANDYNPNSVASDELRLLYTSIREDGYTQPVVTFRDEENDKYVIVDGFHRYLTMRTHEDIQERTGGLLPIVVIEKALADRMASTVRHNRARGKHSVTGMSSLVFGMLDEGKSDAEVCESLGMTADELVRMKHITGFSKLFESVEYTNAWETKRQIKLRLEAENNEG